VEDETFAYKSAVRIIRENLTEYVAVNVLFYGLVAVSMICVFFNPDVQKALLSEVRAGFLESFRLLVEAYTSGNLPLAATLTFAFNLVFGSFVYITLPSFVAPFGGVVTASIRAVGWGLLLAPTSPELALLMVPHSLVLILEGQGYILAMFASYLQWKGVFKPKSVQEESRVNAYLAGVKKTAHIYVLVALLLAISALYEAFEIIYILATA